MVAIPNSKFKVIGDIPVLLINICKGLSYQIDLALKDKYEMLRA